MANSSREQISALADDEVHGGELRGLLDELRQDGELQECWARYNLISDALHANLSAADTSRFHERVWAALDAEPTVLAPRRNTRLPPLAKQAAGLAIAASVAAVAILAVAPVSTQVAEVAPTTTEVAQVAPLSTQVAQVLPPRSANGLVQLTSAGTGQAAVAPQSVRGHLNPYVVNHNEYSISSGMQGVLPYARIVSYENNQ